jgi:uncharacterized membrane protein YhaH (DUF805 family)
MFFEEYISVLKKYAEFDGRAGRREFWMFVFYNFIVSLTLSLLTGGREGAISTLYSLAVFLPSIGVSIRRMHDVDKSGWFILIPFYNLYLAIIQGTVGSNRFGPDTKTTIPATAQTPPPPTTTPEPPKS